MRDRRDFAAAAVPVPEGIAKCDLIDIGSGHWPVLTRPAELARILDEV